MTELNQLIAEFKITLDKFEAIASRMEARTIKLMNIHRYKYEHPKGYPLRVRSDEVYGWAAVKPETGEVDLESFQQFDDELCKLADGWEWKKFTLTLSDSAGPVDPLAALPPFPPLPEGFSRWVYRGKGWKSKERVRFASYGRFDTDWVTFPFGCTIGYETTHYIEAVKDPA